jgi:hypothetical protein
VSDIDRMTTLACGWALALAVLAFDWARMPIEGSGQPFLIWSAPGIVLAVLSWSWLRGSGVRSVHITERQATLLAVLWAALALLIVTHAGDEWALDGLILRNAVESLAGVLLKWVPGIIAAVLSIGGLAAALEARYALTHPSEPAATEEPSGTEVTPTGP